jgi:hypothetical protein
MLHEYRIIERDRYYPWFIGFGGLGVSMLTSGTQERKFEPGQSHQIFWAKKS